MQAQLGLCGGNSGDPIFTENFGVGTTNSDLSNETTTYEFFDGYPDDGYYTVTNGTFGNGFDWHQIEDNTPDDVNGKCLIVNAGTSAGEFYRTTVSGLCEATTYEFSAWIINLVIANSFCSSQPGGTIPINISFEIWDSTDTELLAGGSTGEIEETSTPNWEEYGLVFPTLTGQDSIILKMINNGEGGCGNDLAIDDIVFKTCGDSISVEDDSTNNTITICSGETPYTLNLAAMPDNVVFDSHFYQWQESTDGTTWVDIIGATNEDLTITGITTTTYFRAKVAEFMPNLSNLDCITFSDTFTVTVNQAGAAPTTECWQTATLNNATCSWEVAGTQPEEPTGLECWQTTSFNTTTCSWEITGTQPEEPSGLECWQVTTFNTGTCSWEISGTQPEEPTGLECWQTTSFNTTTCSWEITGTQPEEPSGLECWQVTTFNTGTCSWEISGTQPEEPTGLECWQTTSFNTTTCSWEITGTQPEEPSGLECWQVTTFNTGTCSWEITGTQPEEPTGLECWQSTSFNTASCIWEIAGTQPEEPTGLECWQTTSFNTTTCSWEITGTQPEEPTGLECWQSTSFNTTTCSWEITGTQPEEPSGLECWQSTSFNTATCSWEITGTQPEEPSGLECWQSTSFNTGTCSWETTGTQPEEPTVLECWETTNFNTSTCAWELIGTQPNPPTTECWETATFNDTSCLWEVTGSQPVEPTGLACWETTNFNTTTCEWDIIGDQPIDFVEEFVSFCEGSGVTLSGNVGLTSPEFFWNTEEITEEIFVDESGTYTVEVTNNDCLTIIKTIIVEENTIPVLGSVVSNGEDIVITTLNTGDFEYSLDGINYQLGNVFFNADGGYYTIYVRDINGCGTVPQEHLHFVIPKFFTPNNDGINDAFELRGIEHFETSEVYIFNRYGKLIRSSINQPFFWDGIVGGERLPTTDYWYFIKINGQEFRGHFTLKY